MRLNALEARVTAIEAKQKTDEEQAIQDLKDTIKKYEDRSTHWTRYVVAALVSLTTGGVLLLIGRWIAKH